MAARVACVSALFACGPAPPADPVDALEQNVRHVCELELGLCNGQDIVPEAVERCVDAQATNAQERALEMGEECLQIYAEMFACFSDWSCEDFRSFTGDPDAPCQPFRTELNDECPGLSPFSVDQPDEPSEEGN